MHPFLKLQHISKVFNIGKQKLQALHNINLIIHEGEFVAVVGESGSGKSTLGKIVMNLETPSSGEIFLQNASYSDLSRKELARKIQMVFQNPYSALNPRLSIENIIGEGIDIHKIATGAARREKIVSLLKEMELPEESLSRYPNEFSGGQRQRINIARALAVDPSLLICDEPLSALDQMTQQSICHLFIHLQKERQLSYLFISHDLNTVRQMANSVVVMYLGKIVERASKEQLFRNPTHPYTQALLSAIPIPDPKIERKRPQIPMIGEIPSPLNPPSGCAFHPRCPHAKAICKQIPPPIKEPSPGHQVSCHFS